jgi:hypothetical protein
MSRARSSRSACFDGSVQGCSQHLGIASEIDIKPLDRLKDMSSGQPTKCSKQDDGRTGGFKLDRELAGREPDLTPPPHVKRGSTWKLTASGGNRAAGGVAARKRAGSGKTRSLRITTQLDSGHDS